MAHCSGRNQKTFRCNSLHSEDLRRREYKVGGFRAKRWSSATRSKTSILPTRPPNGYSAARLYGDSNDNRTATAAGKRRSRSSLETLGAIPLRAPVGNGPRGLQRRRRRVGLFSARSCAFTRLPVGGRWH